MARVSLRLVVARTVPPGLLAAVASRAVVGPVRCRLAFWPRWHRGRWLGPYGAAWPSGLGGSEGGGAGANVDLGLQDQRSPRWI